MLALFSIQLYSQNHKIAFLSHPIGASGAIQALYLKVSTERNFVVKFYRANVSFIRKKQSTVSEPPFGGLKQFIDP